MQEPKKSQTGGQIALSQLKRDIEISKDKLFFIKHIAAGSTQSKWYLVQVDMYQLYPIDMRDYEVY